MPDWWPPARRPRATLGALIAASVTNVARREGMLLFFRTSPPFGRTIGVRQTCWQIPLQGHAGGVVLVLGFRGAWMSRAPPRVPKEGRP